MRRSTRDLSPLAASRWLALCALGWLTVAAAVPARAGWESIGPDVPVSGTSLVLDGLQPGVLYLGSEASGVHRSSDDATSWTPRNDGLPRGVTVLALDPATPSTLYAVGWGQGRMVRSLDSGGSWQPASPPFGFLFGLAVDPSRPGVLFGVGAGIHRSTDAAQSWNTVYQHTDGEGDEETLCRVHVTSDGSAVYATSEHDGLLRSTDGGDGWQRVGVSVVTWACEDVRLDTTASSPQVLYVAGENGLARSTDAGATFGAITTLPGWVAAIAADPRDAHGVHVAVSETGTGRSRLLRSTDGGATFQDIAGPWREASARIGAIAIGAGDAGNLYVATTSGVFRSADDGVTWRGGHAGMRGGWTSAIAVDPTSPNHLFLATGLFALQRSTDGGASFAAAGRGLEDSLVTDVATDPRRPARVYASRSVAPAGGGVSRSIDGGDRFLSFSHGLPANPYDPALTADVERVIVDPQQSHVLYALAWVDGGVYRSTNAGRSWRPYAEGLAQEDRLNAVASAVDPSSGVLYLASRTRGSTPGALYRRAPGAASWQRFAAPDSPLPSYEDDVFAIAVDPTNGDVLYVGTLGAGVFRSSDGGRSWQAAASGLPSDAVVRLAVDPANAATLFAETTSGVFRSDDRGESWADISAGLFPRVGGGLVDGDMTLDASALATLYTGTDGGGAYRYRLPCEAATLSVSRLDLGRLRAPARDDELSFAGSFDLATGRVLQPETVGLRLRILDAKGAPLGDLSLPGGNAWRPGPGPRTWSRRGDLRGKGRWRVDLTQRGDRVELSLTGRGTSLAAAADALPATVEVGIDTDGSERTCATSAQPLDCEREDGGRRVRCG